MRGRGGEKIQNFEDVVCGWSLERGSGVLGSPQSSSKANICSIFDVPHVNLKAREEEEEVGWPKKVWATMPDFLEAEKGGVNRVATKIHSVLFIRTTLSLRLIPFSYSKILQEHNDYAQSRIFSLSIMIVCVNLSKWNAYC